MNNNNLDINIIGVPGEQRDDHEDGIVTLTGAVSRHGERDDAMILATCVPGVLGVMDSLVLIPAPRQGDADANTQVGIPAPRPGDADISTDVDTSE
jgi:hypothetical protein